MSAVVPALCQLIRTRGQLNLASTRSLSFCGASHLMGMHSFMHSNYIQEDHDCIFRQRINNEEEHVRMRGCCGIAIDERTKKMLEA